MKNHSKFAIGLSCLVAVIILGFTVFIVANSHGKDDENVLQETKVADLTPSKGEGVYAIQSEMMLLYDISDPKVMAENSQYVAIVTIDSIDGVDNYSEVHQSFVSPYTYGHMTVVQSIKGDLPLGENVEFSRLGGAISVDRYYAGLSEIEKERFNYARETDEKLAASTAIEIVRSEDIKIEAGKTYLVYMGDEVSYSGKPNSYAIGGFAGGLREIQGGSINVAGTDSSSEIKVMNNFTGEWENLSDIIKVTE